MSQTEQQAMPSNKPPAEAVQWLYSIEHENWSGLKLALQQALLSRGQDKLISPLTPVLRNLLEDLIHLLHQRVFQDIIGTNSLQQPANWDEQLRELYRVEVGAHGVSNLIRACKERNWHLAVAFPPPQASGEDTLVRLSLPVNWHKTKSVSAKLIETLGYQIHVDNSESACQIKLTLMAGWQPSRRAAQIMDYQQREASLEHIFDALDFGLIHFSFTGEILDISPSMLNGLNLDISPASTTQVEQIIPQSFHHDITWNQGEIADGKFANYRIRLSIPDGEWPSVLYNVSGFRRIDGSIFSLWQKVSGDIANHQLAQGSMASDMRVFNITRHYVSKLVQQKAREAVRRGQTELVNEERNVAVLFCDIVSFTAFVEDFAASESVIDSLNSILSRVSNAVTANGGDIDKFMGDCLMALFNNPADAIKAALDMQAYAQDINNLRNRAGHQPLRLRIGIHWGKVIIGNVGTTERFDWTAIGDVVNSASRLEKACQPGAILISQSLRDEVEASQPQRFSYGEKFTMQLKGRSAQMPVCEVKLSDDASKG